MNKGIEMSNGEYILFLNSGDLLVNERILEVFFNNHFTEEIVVGNCRITQNEKVIFTAIPPEEISFNIFFYGSLPHQSTFIRKDLFKRLGYYSEKYRIHSDMDFFVKALIINDCSYRHINMTVSEYNMEGISSQYSNNSMSKKEHDDILRKHISPRIILDYENWAIEHNSMKVLYWFKNKPILYSSLSSIFYIFTALSKFTKTFKNNPCINSHICH